MTVDEARARFPVLERYAYLNAGTFGPLARRTMAAVAEAQQAELERGRAGPEYFQRLLGLRETVRAALAAQIGVPAGNVALTGSTTAGCNLVLQGLGLGPEDEVVTTTDEHFGLIGPLLVSGTRLRVVAPEVDAILAAVGPRTRLLALSHVTWTAGKVLPIAELRAESGLPVLADGAQGAGAIPVDATGVDFYTVSAQKWLCGPDATGALFVRDPEALQIRSASYFGQASYDLDEPSWEPKPGAARFDPGPVPVPALAGLEAALADLPEWRFERARELTDRCHALLSERFDVISEPGQGTLVSWRPGGGADPAALSEHAYERGVIIRHLPSTGWLRASCGWWTSEDDLARLVEAVS
jgi:L-cysteine/cystine lyase